ncbi:MAG: DUF423 domain-containing protein [Bacteroidota bacterium]|jgi:uncharacterized membrane protein YgdD (TMEM256/DUF423 family)|nr:DUF423 domain-containing protein [Terrimonas sp.]
MDKVNFFLASLFAATAVAAGAFGAHGLQRLTAEATVIQTYQTAVQYHFWHAIALLLAGLLAPYGKPQLNYWARQSFLAGLICFSGSLYLLTYLRLQQLLSFKWIVFITPIGGLFLIMGWVLLGFSFTSFKQSN